METIIQEILKEHLGANVDNTIEAIIDAVLSDLSAKELEKLAEDADAWTAYFMDWDDVINHLNTLDNEQIFWLGHNSDVSGEGPWVLDGYSHLKPVYDKTDYIDKNVIRDYLLEGNFSSLDIDIENILNTLSDSDEEVLTLNLYKEITGEE